MEEGLQYNTGKVVEEFIATYMNLQQPVAHVSDLCKDYQILHRFLFIWFLKEAHESILD